VRALRDMLKYDANYPDPSRLVVMLSNHDVRRTASVKGMTTAGLMLHTAFLLSVRGTPQLYYADEIAMEGMDDPDNRRDFPGGWASDRRNAFEESGRTPPEQRMYQWTRDWIQLRRDHRAIRRGSLVDLFYDDDAYVYARRDESETIIIALNRSLSPKPLTIPAGWLEAADGARLLPLLGATQRVVATNGRFTLELPGSTAVAYRLVADEPVR
jgi:glycosidase